MSDVPKIDEVPIVKKPCSERINHLNELFNQEFGCYPSFFVRVPGRVNIIGEHIDYCGYPVLPMAIEQDILLAAGLTKKTVLNLRNVNSKYVDFQTTIKSNEDLIIEPDSNGKPFWYNYVLCGIKGALEYLNDKMINGLQIYVDGNVPPASGLSSSSALVSASCLSFLYAQNVSLSKTEIASLCAKSERYIGTQGGGMDQAIGFLAEKYSAQYITWDPLNATPVALPENSAFVVAHSVAEANKAATHDFNRRVIECRLAAKILATCKELTQERKIITLSYLQKLLNYNLEDMVNLVYEFLPNDVYLKKEISDILKISEEDIDELYLTPNTRHLTEFKLRQRALHVYEEAARVEEFRKICCAYSSSKDTLNNGTNGFTTNDNGISESNIIDVLGNLMSESHKSLKTLYECSHDNLDRLVALSKEVNVHSRLTGAGWGGCIVALCHKDKVDEYIKSIIDKFYKHHCNIDEAKALAYVFATTPNQGAEIYIN